VVDRYDPPRGDRFDMIMLFLREKASFYQFLVELSDHGDRIFYYFLGAVLFAYI
jgi:hypothetical protein